MRHPPFDKQTGKRALRVRAAYAAHRAIRASGRVPCAEATAALAKLRAQRKAAQQTIPVQTLTSVPRRPDTLTGV